MEADQPSRILFYDTETTGLPVWKSSPENPAQPHIVQLAGLLLTADKSVAGELNVIVKPQGYQIPKQASDIHGITQERAMDEGIPLWKAMWLFERLLTAASLRVAHNVAFDDLILCAAYYRLQMSRSPLDLQSSFCTMEATTPILKLPGNYGRYKWPKLIEANRHFFGEDFDDAHDAMADLKACAGVYFAIQES